MTARGFTRAQPCCNCHDATPRVSTCLRPRTTTCNTEGQSIMEQPFGHTQVPIAIVGMACRLPGADNLDQYWDLLSRGGSAVGELPPERLDQELYYDPRVGVRGKSY